MKKTLIALLALSGIAMADTLTWQGPTKDGDWTKEENWTTTGDHTVPQNNDTIVIDNGSTVVHDKDVNQTGFIDGTTVYKVSNGSHLTLGTKAADKNNPVSNPRYDGSFEVDSTSSITTCAAFFKGTSNIYGEFYLKNMMKPQTDATINFGETGFIAFVSGSKNAMEGDNHTLTLGAILDIGNVVGDATTYTLETRYLIKGVEGGTFDPTDYNKLTLAGGTMTGTNKMKLAPVGGNQVFEANNTAYTTATLEATAENYGKYLLGADKNGVYVKYVKAIPEPTAATLSLLALVGLAARRRRK